MVIKDTVIVITWLQIPEINGVGATLSQLETRYI